MDNEEIKASTLPQNNDSNIIKSLTMPNMEENDINAVDEEDEEYNKLYSAVCNSRLSEVKSLIDQGSNINILDENGFGLLLIACQLAELTILELLIEVNAKIDIINLNGTTALHYCSEYNKIEAMQILLRNGANTDIQDDNGCSPLHCAAIKNNIGAVELLLDHKADPTIQDKEGYTAYEYAVDFSSMRLAGLMFHSENGFDNYEHESDKDATDENDATVYHLGSSFDH